MYLARAKLRHTVRVTAVDVCVCVMKCGRTAPVLSQSVYAATTA